MLLILNDSTFFFIFSLLLPLALYSVRTYQLSFILYLLYLGALDLIASSILLVAVTWEFKLGGKNNTINTAFFMPLFTILLRAVISMPFDCIIRFLYLYSNIQIFFLGGLLILNFIQACNFSYSLPRAIYRFLLIRYKT